MPRIRDNLIVDLARTKLIPLIQDRIRFAALYGSRAVKGSACKGNADVDIFIILHRGSSVCSVIEEAVRFFHDLGLTADPFWYVYDHFLTELEAKRDLSLWHHIFVQGCILCPDEGIQRRVRDTLAVTAPAESFRATLAVRRSRNREMYIQIMRNLDRILAEALWLLLSNRTKTTSWDEIPSYDDLVDNACSEGIISSDVYSVSVRLRELKKGIHALPESFTLEMLGKIERDILDFVAGVTE